MEDLKYRLTDEWIMFDGKKLYRIEEDNSVKLLNIYEDIEVGMEDDYFAVKRNGLWGFINQNGEEVIEPQYEKYVYFKDGFAEVFKNHKSSVCNFSPSLCYSRFR